MGNLNITVDVDLSYVNLGMPFNGTEGGRYLVNDLVPNKNNNSNWRIKNRFEIFDVYNNGKDFGGKLRVIHDRFVSVHGNDTVQLTKSSLYPKIAHRKSFEDAKLRIGLIVRHEKLENIANFIFDFFSTQNLKTIVRFESS